MKNLNIGIATVTPGPEGSFVVRAQPDNSPTLEEYLASRQEVLQAAEKILPATRDQLGLAMLNAVHPTWDAHRLDEWDRTAISRFSNASLLALIAVAWREIK